MQGSIVSKYGYRRDAKVIDTCIFWYSLLNIGTAIHGVQLFSQLNDYLHTKPLATRILLGSGTDIARKRANKLKVMHPQQGY